MKFVFCTACKLPNDYRMGPVEIAMFFLNYDVYSTHLSLNTRSAAFHWHEECSISLALY